LLNEHDDDVTLAVKSCNLRLFHVIIAPVIMPTHKALSLLEVLACLLKMELAKSSQACGSTCVCAEAKV
jgi:hypothetical protein